MSSPAAAALAAPQLSLSLVGVPNCGKTALFNRLTGSRQKVANYPGVTVERKEGRLTGPRAGRLFRVVDLPGAYSLEPATLDEAIARDVVLGRHATEPAPDLLVCVVDATNLRLSLRLVLELKRLGRPMIVALNMSDLAAQRGYTLDRAALERALGVPVVPTVAVRAGGERALIEALDSYRFPPATLEGTAALGVEPPPAASAADIEATQREVRRVLNEAGYRVPARLRMLSRLDAVVLNPVAGPALLAVVLFLMFQAVFSWAKAPQNLINTGVQWLNAALGGVLPQGPLRGLLLDGVIAGTGSVLVFLPQILILFLFILALEDSGYLPRAAFMLDRLMGRVGLSGRAFIPLLSSFACAIPGIMAARTIPSSRDRLATIMIAPLMTCSARLPVYALLIGAFIPQHTVGIFNLRGLVLFALYLAGVASALLVAFVLKRTVMRGEYRPLLLELPEYRWPHLQNLALGLWERTRIFLTRVGTIILSLMVVLWFLASFPAPPAGATGPAIQYSVAGFLGRGLEYLFAPIGFNWQISIALVPGLAAREVAVSALGTVYAMSGAKDVAGALAPVIAQGWSIATGLSLLAWYVFAPQCLSTLAVVKRETNSWRYPLYMAAYLFALAYLGAFVTYRVALMLGGGAS
ncbi:MAG: ferrous iron transporter B [Gammaproteobacteria bacterium]|nr:MAG: ferrous iron transporter B [Gammaproteobacteria bacterium]TLZ08817.1 MAG: ferrous iron transporter B [Gammaproteobacteria bacterium]